MNRFIIVVEHDLSVLDYLSDFICCLYGMPGAYGVVTMPFSVREGTFLFETFCNAYLLEFPLDRYQYFLGRICAY